MIFYLDTSAATATAVVSEEVLVVAVAAEPEVEGVGSNSEK